MTRSYFYALGLAVAGCLSAGSVHAQACKPDFGELMLTWAKQEAPQQSRELARLDYETRIRNYMLLTFEEANVKMAQVASDLDTAAARIRTDEAAASTDPVLAAVAREHEATKKWSGSMDRFEPIPVEQPSRAKVCTTWAAQPCSHHSPISAMRLPPHWQTGMASSCG
jgi:hypothetical protein